MDSKNKLKTHYCQLLKTAFFASLLFMGSCTNNETLTDLELNSSKNNDLSSASVKLRVISAEADEEQSKNPAPNAIDDDLDSRWSAFGSSVNLILDLGSVNLVDYVKIAYYKGDERTSSFQVYGSTNSSSWTLVGTKSSSGSTESFQTFDIRNSDARYLRIKCLGNSKNNWNSILGIEVYGTKGDGNTVIETPPSSGLAGRFTLSDFQIETSWLSGENSRSTTSFTATSKDNESWYDKSGNTYWLRSLETDGNRTEWKEYPGKEASLNTYKKLQYEAVVNNIPENGVTVTQVHNRGGVRRPLLRVYIDDDRYMKIKVTRTNPTASSSSYDVYEGPFYEEGTKYKMELITDDGDVSIRVETTDGVMNRTISPSNDWDDFSDSYYLKAGVYTEGDNSNPRITFNYFVVDK